VITTILLAAAMALHPGDPLSVDQLVELTLHQDRVAVSAVLDLEQIPTKQLTPDCAAFSAALDVRVGANTLQWTVQSQLLERQGAAGLETSRLTCTLSAPAALGEPARIVAANRYLPDRNGILQLVVASESVSIPADLPPSERAAEFSVQPGAGTSHSSTVVKAERSWLQRGEDWLARALGDPTPLVLPLAILMAALLGAVHAALPGHGKTVMALYMAGRQGRRRDAVIVGTTVTFTHTAGVLILGIATSAFASLAAESVLKWLGIASGALVAVVGTSILIGGLRHRHAHHHHLSHHHHHHDAHGRKNLTALGIAGGLVPSPTALVVLLGAAALGRLWLGIVLIVVYGLGMATTLTAAGLLLLKARDRWAWLGRVAVPPEATGSVIILFGFGLAARALAF
jgi:nickel/cobalt exporter